MMRGIFVTGTDTGVGKTFVACALLRTLRDRGVRAVGMKPVAAGIAPGASLSEDVIALQAAAGIAAPLECVNPYAFAAPIAPHVAAAQAGRTIALDPIVEAYAALCSLADAVVVEGAGGPLVPLGPRLDMLDIAAGLRLPVLLVVGVRLGCINHALGAELAIRARGLVLAGWVANRIDPGMLVPEASIAAIAARVGAPCLATFGPAAGDHATFNAAACAALGFDDPPPRDGRTHERLGARLPC